MNNAEDMLDEEIEDGENQLDEAYSRQPQQFPAPLAPRTGTLKRAKPAPPAEDAVSEYGFGDLAKGPDASYEVGRYTDDLVGDPHLLCPIVLQFHLQQLAHITAVSRQPSADSPAPLQSPRDWWPRL